MIADYGGNELSDLALRDSCDVVLVVFTEGEFSLLITVILARCGTVERERESK